MKTLAEYFEDELNKSVMIIQDDEGYLKSYYTRDGDHFDDEEIDEAEALAEINKHGGLEK